MGSESRDKRMVQTVLNFRPSGTNPEGKHPAFVKATAHVGGFQSPGFKEDKDVEMEDAPSTQSSALSWSATSTTVSQDTQQQRNESKSGFGMTDQREQRGQLRYIAAETISILPTLLAELDPHARPSGYLYAPPNPPRLRQSYCPRYRGTAISVHDADTLDTAIELANCAKYVKIHDKSHVCVLNMANAYRAGGGWKNGALAQEEALCYRSSLFFTLKVRHYPIPEFGAIYSPRVVVIRESMAQGHRLYRLDRPEKLPIVSVVSVAAQCEPRVVTDGENKERYAKAQDRETMKEKMRVILRTAAYNRHRRLVLGALGCGAFRNPRHDVADCWVDVLNEQEFSGGWWESVVFAVMGDADDNANGDGNFGVFYRKLHGMVV